MFTHLFLTSACAEEVVSEVAEPTPTWFQNAFGDFADMPLWAWLVMAVLLVGGVIVYRAGKGGQKTVWTAKMMSVGAMCIALSSVLSMIKLMEMPSGGSITPASMLPMMLFAFVYGTLPGLTLGAVYGLLQFLIGGTSWFLSVPQMLMDYPLAFAMMGLAGLFRRLPHEKTGLALGVVIASLGRFIMAVLAGLLFWTDLTGGLWPAIVYSLGYNGAYMSVECVLCVALALAIGPRLVKELRKVK